MGREIIGANASAEKELLKYIPEYDQYISLLFVQKYSGGVLQRRVLSLSLLGFSVYMIVGEMYGTNHIFGINGITLRTVWFGIMIISMEIYSFRIMNNIVFQEIGKRSYSIYLTQFIIID